MKRVISIALLIFLIINIVVFPVSATDEYRYEELPVEYSDNKGITESLNIMIEGQNVYVDAVQLGSRLGYTVELSSNEDSVFFYKGEEVAKAQRLLFYVLDDVKVGYLLSNMLYQYEAPFASVRNERGIWVPLKYTLFALNSSMLIVEGVVSIEMPHKTLSDIMREITNNGNLIVFDYWTDTGYSELGLNVKEGASRIINLFNGILTGERESWQLLFQQFVGDTSAYDDKFGSSIVQLFCINSDKELKELNENISLLNDIFSQDGNLGTALSRIKTDIDSNVNSLYTQLDYIFQNIENENSDLAKYSATYEQLERAVDKKTWFSNSGEMILEVQKELTPVVQTLNVIGEVAEVAGYLQEFTEKDVYSVQALQEYLSRAYADPVLGESLINEMMKEVQLFNSNIAHYSISKYIEENVMDWIGDGLSITQWLGTQANLTLLAWNIASAIFPFVSNGLDSAENFELSIYAQVFQYDAYTKYINYKNEVFGNESLTTAQNCYKIAQLLYTYLKASYIARDAGIASFNDVKDKPEAQAFLQSLDQQNQKVAEYLADLKMMTKDNRDCSLGFLPENSEWLVRNYDDSDLLRLFGYEVEIQPITNRQTSGERDIVLVLDTSGSMSGTPIEETRKASVNFIDTILQEDASIGVVTYEDSANMLSDFSMDRNALESVVNGIGPGGSTNIEAGLQMAREMLEYSNAEKKIIVLMSDGEPNMGKVGEDLISYADEIKAEGTYIYTLGFFESLGNKASAQALMEGIASEGCHYEVDSADNLVFFFGDIADQINGTKYIYIRIACPVDVTVSYNGETLDSAEENLSTRTSFGSLTFEEYEDEANEDDAEDRIKVLRLKEGTDYDIEINGTGRGKMDYTIGFMDETGEYSDLRKFRNIAITSRTKIDTVATVSNSTVLNVDEDGDGKYDLKYKAGENEFGELVDYTYVIYIAAGAVALLIVLIVGVKMRKRFRKKGSKNN